MNSSGVKAISLFSGAGGLDFAICQSMQICKLVSTDSNPVFLSTVERNIPRHFPNVDHSTICENAQSLKAERLLELLGGRPDLLVGGPPCEDFTSYGLLKGLRGDKGPLIFDFARLVKETSPSVFIFENVPNLLTVAASGFKRLLRVFEEAGYRNYWSILNASDFGAPTKRQRLFIVGISDSIGDRPYTFPEATYAATKDGNGHTNCHVHVKDVLEDLPDPSECSPDKYLNHIPRRHKPHTLAAIKRIKSGTWARILFRYRAPWHGLCASLVAGQDNATKSHIHPKYHREMTVREYARIHGFPDTWFFSGTRNNGAKQVANSVPIPLGIAVARSVASLVSPEIKRRSKGKRIKVPR